MRSFFRPCQWAFLFFALWLMAGCGAFGLNSAKVKYPNAVTSAMREEFNQAEKDFEASRYGEAEKKYRLYLQNFPYNQLADTATFRVGQIAMLRQAYPQAIQIFQNLIRKTPDPAIKSKSNIKIGICYYRQNKFSEAFAAFGSSRDSYLDTRERTKMASFAVRSGTQLNADLNKRAYYYAILYDNYYLLQDSEIVKEFGKDSLSKTEVTAQLKKWIESVTPIEEIDRRLQEYKGKYSEPLLTYKMGKSYYESRDNKHAQQWLKKYVSKNPGHEYVDQANKLLATIGDVKSSPNKSDKVYAIGVILPLSGKYEQYGNNALKGMECAASVRPTCNGTHNVQLIVKDSGSDPARAALMVDELVTKDKVVAIVGPLPSSEVEAVAKQAQTHGVPIIALVQKKGVTELGDQVFRFSLTPTTQLKALLNYAARQKNAKSYGVFYPQSNYGQEFLAEMEKTVSDFGGKIISKQGFSPTKADLSDEIRQLRSSSSQIKADGKSSFDALLIPDSYISVGRMAPGLAKAGLGEGLILGTNAWNDSSLAAKVDSNLKQVVFVDLYFRNSAQPAVQGFVKEFQDSYGYPPSTLEAMGYDAIRVVGDSLTGKKISRKEEVKTALSQMNNYRGVTGLRGFQESREAVVEPYLLTVEGNEIKEVK